MAVTIKEVSLKSFGSGKINFLSFSGKLDKQDYALFVPTLETGIKAHGKINLLVELHNFDGWTAGAAWEDTKFGVRHFNDIQRLAIVGDRKWEKNLARFAKVFTRAKVRYFDEADTEQAHEWIQSV